MNNSEHAMIDAEKAKLIERLKGAISDEIKDILKGMGPNWTERQHAATLAVNYLIENNLIETI